MTASTLSGEEYRAEWASWLTEVFQDGSYPKNSGSSLVTLTFAPRGWESDGIGPTGPTRSRVARAGLRFEKHLIRALERPSYFGVREIGGWNGRAHLHFLISSRESVGTREAMRWHEVKEGFVTVRSSPISPTDYVTKYVSKSDGDWWVAGGPAFNGPGRRGDLSRAGGRSSTLEFMING